jgi:hypothetical protein
LYSCVSSMAFALLLRLRLVTSRGPPYPSPPSRPSVLRSLVNNHRCRPSHWLIYAQVTSPRSPRPASARAEGPAALAAQAAAAPAPTLLRTPRTRRRIWLNRRGRRGRGGRLAPRLSAGATRTSPPSPCGGPAPRSTSPTSARAATDPPCRRSASTRRRGRRRITTVNYTHVIRTSRGDGVWSRRETPHFRLPLDARAKRSAQGVVLQSDTTRRRHCIAV